MNQPDNMNDYWGRAAGIDDTDLDEQEEIANQHADELYEQSKLERE